MKDCPQNFIVALEASLLGRLFIFRQSFSPGHYPPIYQPPEGVYLLISQSLIIQCRSFIEYFLSYTHEDLPKYIYIFFIYYRVDYVASKITLISGFMTRGRHHRFLNSYVTSHKNVQKKHDKNNEHTRANIPCEQNIQICS